MTEQTITHQLTWSFLEELGGGPISPESMDVLLASVHSVRRALLLLIDKHLTGDSRAQNSLRVISRAESRHPGVVRDVLMNPPTGVWLVRAVRESLTTDSPDDELGYLHCVAAAVAIRTGTWCTLTVPVIQGAVCIPTVGSVPAPAGNTGATAQLHVSRQSRLRFAGVAEPVVLGADSPRFIPTRTHRASARGFELVVEIDAGNPYREFSGPEPPHPMTPAEWDHWHILVDQAWDLLTLRHPAYARELSAGLVTLAPIFSGRNVVGSSSHAAFGAIAFSPKVSAVALAEVMVHELQHSKLNAVLDLVSLHEGDQGRLWYAPWRTDPRPLSGLLHGIYAFTSVVEFWRSLRGHISDTQQALKADYVFAHRRHQVRQAVDALASSSELTELGRQFVAGVADRIALCEQEPISAALSDVVSLAETDRWVTWRLRHIRPDAGHIDRLATAWLANDPAPPRSTSDTVRPFARTFAAGQRTKLLEAKVTDPSGFDRTIHSGADRADARLALGDHEGAAALYAARIQASGSDAAAWAGLAVSTAPRTPASAALLATPETVMELYNRLLAQDRPPSPVELAAWLGAGPAEPTSP